MKRLVARTWIEAHCANVRVWYEFVESEANWADGISRLLDFDPFAQNHGFQTRSVPFDCALVSSDPLLLLSPEKKKR